MRLLLIEDSIALADQLLPLFKTMVMQSIG